MLRLIESIKDCVSQVSRYYPYSLAATVEHGFRGSDIVVAVAVVMVSLASVYSILKIDDLYQPSLVISMISNG